MRRSRILPLVLALALAPAGHAATIFSDGFEPSPGGDDVAGSDPTGWTVSDGTASGDIDVVVTTTSPRSGSQALRFDHIGPGTNPSPGGVVQRSFTLTSLTDTAIQIVLHARQTSDLFESFNDLFSIRAGFAGGFTTYTVDDTGVLNGGTFTFSGGHETQTAAADSGTGSTAYVQYTLNLPSADSVGETTLNLRIHGQSSHQGESGANAENEDYWIDDVAITGIPEPSTALLLGAALGALALRGRRHRA